ncbi:MAG: phosphodiester glycosidase family protein [Acidobacteriota bacterium]
MPSWKALGPGIEYRTLGCDDKTHTFALHLLRVDPRRVPLKAVVTEPAHVEDVVRSQNALFGLNANFFDDKRRPLGVALENGKPLNRPHPVVWMSIFAIYEDGRPEILLSSRWNHARSGARMAVQAGPRIVVDGELTHIKPTGPSRRSGVCIQSPKQVVFFVTPGNHFLTVEEIAALGQRSETSEGMGCRDAMLFDGGGSAQFYLHGQPDAIEVFGDEVPAFLIGGSMESGSN